MCQAVCTINKRFHFTNYLELFDMYFLQIKKKHYHTFDQSGTDQGYIFDQSVCITGVQPWQL